MESIMHRIINWSGLWELQEEIRQLENETERDTRNHLLLRALDAITDYDVHVREYAWKQTIQDLLDRGIAIEPIDRAMVVSQWDACFDSLVSDEAKRAAEHYSDQFRWHLFSFDLLPAVQGDEARAAFDRVEKQELYLFFDRVDLCYLIKNAHLLTAADIEVVKENSPLDYMDMYFFNPAGEWSYVKTHEEYCGPYFFIVTEI